MNTCFFIELSANTTCSDRSSQIFADISCNNIDFVKNNKCAWLQLKHVWKWKFNYFATFSKKTYNWKRYEKNHAKIDTCIMPVAVTSTFNNSVSADLFTFLSKFLLLMMIWQVWYFLCTKSCLFNPTQRKCMQNSVNSKYFITTSFYNQNITNDRHLMENSRIFLAFAKKCIEFKIKFKMGEKINITNDKKWKLMSFGFAKTQKNNQPQRPHQNTWQNNSHFIFLWNYILFLFV